MIDFSSIANDDLRRLAMSSPAIATLPEAEAATMIAKLASAREEDQAFYITTFEKEQVDLAEIDQHWSKSLTEAATQVADAEKELQRVKREYDAALLTSRESNSRAEDEKRSEDILAQLQSL